MQCQQREEELKAQQQQARLKKRKQEEELDEKRKKKSPQTHPKGYEEGATCQWPAQEEAHRQRLQRQRPDPQQQRSGLPMQRAEPQQQLVPRCRHHRRRQPQQQQGLEQQQQAGQPRTMPLRIGCESARRRRTPRPLQEQPWSMTAGQREEEEAHETPRHQEAEAQSDSRRPTPAGVDRGQGSPRTSGTKATGRSPAP